MTNNYHIVLQDGVNQSDLYSLVTSVVDEISFRSTYFIAECTDAQAQTLRDHDSVKFVNKPVPISPAEEDDDTLFKTVNFRRMKRDHTPGAGTWLGNWGLIRHGGGGGALGTAQQNLGGISNNIPPDDGTDKSAIYRHHTFTDGAGDGTVQDLDGTGVDIIMPLGTILERIDTEFYTNGVTRLESFQWNTLPGMSVLPTVEYNSTLFGRSGTSDASIQHSEAVAYIACSNTYGWATGSKIYVFPRNQMNNAGKDPFEYFYDCARLFHEAKAGTGDADRPTVVISSFSKKLDITNKARALFFRNELYTTVAPGGSDEVPVIEGVSFGSRGDIASVAFGRKYLCPRSGYVDLSSQSGNPYTVEPGYTQQGKEYTSAIEDYRDKLMSFASNDSSYNAEYAVYMEPVKDMTDAGVHHIVAAGNAGAKLCLPTNPDYNNAYIDPLTSTSNQLHNMYFYNRPGWHVGPDTIVVGAISAHVHGDPEGNMPGYQYTGFEVDTNTGAGTNKTTLSKETIAPFSNKGDRVDTCAAGENIFLGLASLGAGYVYNATGTSFACPQVGGMVAQILQAYPTTTVGEMRKYIRDVATATHTTFTNTQQHLDNNPGAEKVIVDPPLYDTKRSPIVGTKFGDYAYFGNNVNLMGYSGNIVIHPTQDFNSGLGDIAAYANNNNGGTPSGTLDKEALQDPRIRFTGAELQEKLSRL